MSKSLYVFKERFFGLNPKNRDELCDYIRSSYGYNGTLDLASVIPLKNFRNRILLSSSMSIYMYELKGDYDSISTSIDVYVGDYSDWITMTYNKLQEKYTYCGQMMLDVTDGYRTYDLSKYNSLLENVFSYDCKYLILVLKSNENNKSAELESSSGLYLAVISNSLQPVVSNPQPNAELVYKNKETVISWEYEGDGSEQKEYEIGWSSDGGNTWNTEIITSSQKKHIYPAETFPEGIVTYRIKSTAEEGLTSEYLYAQFVSAAQRPHVEITYPNGVNIIKSKNQMFTWNYDGEDLEQISYEIGWSIDDGETWNNTTVTSKNNYHEFIADTFPDGKILWRLRATNSDGYTGEYDYASFDSVGKGEIPSIDSVTQDAIPLISWSIDNQEAFEVEILQNGILYGSGMIPGNDVREFKPNVILKDGIYIIRVRIMNIYGYISDWGTTSFNLNTLKPESNPVLHVMKNDLYGVSLFGSGVTGKGFYIRKDGENETVVAEYSPYKEIIDCNIKSEKEYSYVLRDYVKGYVDSEEIKLQITFHGVVINEFDNVQNMINIYLSENDYVEDSGSLSKNTVYKQCVGREFSVKETDSKKTESISVTGFLSKVEYERLYRLFYENKNVLFRSENYCCKADISDLKKQKYFNRGYIVEVKLERVDDDKEVSVL